MDRPASSSEGSNLNASFATFCSRIIDRALDDHLQQLDNVLETVRLPVADGPDSTLRGWEAADEGGALGLGFQHLPADQVTQKCRSQTGGPAP